MDVRELDIDLIDRINPFGEAYAILAKTMSEDSLKQVAAAIAAKRTSLTPEEAKELAVRAVQVQEGTRTAPVAHFAGCLGKADGRRRRRLCPLQGRRVAMSDLDLDELRAELDDFAAAGEEGRTLAARGAHHRRIRGNTALRRKARPRPAAWGRSRHLRAALCRAPRPSARA